MKTPIEMRSWVFFYGNYMSVSALREAGVIPEDHRVARLHGYRLDMSPRANIIKELDASVWGVVAALNHEDMKRLHTGTPTFFYCKDFYPIAVLTFDRSENVIPALCYVCHEMEPSRPQAAYVDNIAAMAEEYGFPENYVETIRSFAA